MKNNILLIFGLLLFIVIIISPLKIPFIQKATLATASIMAFFWATEVIPIPVVSLFPLILFPLFGVQSSDKVAKAYADPVIYLFLGGFMLAIAIEKWKLHLRIALKILIFFKGSLALTLLGFMVSTAFLSMWISNTACTMMMLPITLSVISLLKEKTPDLTENYPRALLLSIAYASSIGGIGTLIGTPPNLLLASFYSRQFPQDQITFLKWFQFGFPFILILTPIAWLILIFYSGGFKKLKGNFFELKNYLLEEKKKIGKVSLQEKLVFYVFLIVSVLWIFRAPISFGSFKILGWGSIFPHSSFFHDSFVAIFGALILFFVKIDKKPILEWNEVEKRVPWGILLLFGGGLALADTFIESGLSKSISGIFIKFQILPFPVFLFLICSLMVILTEFTSNTAITATMLPVIFSIVPSNTNPLTLLLPATISASLAFMLPVATPPNAIVFSSGHLKVSTMLKVGISLDIIALFLLTSLSLIILK
jgi:sodium-dependent dicarboxylate transporter 2/3/5